MFEKLKIQLDQQDWPAVYMFKFILTNDPIKIAQVAALFDDEANVRMQPSKTNKYISFTATELILSSDLVIERYEKAAKIEGVISL